MSSGEGQGITPGVISTLTFVSLKEEMENSFLPKQSVARPV